MMVRSLGIAALALALAPSAACAAPPPSQTQLFELPTGAGIHDIAPAPDGKVWYTAQRGGALGILDPKTGHGIGPVRS